MKSKRLVPVLLGVTAIAGSLTAITTVGAKIADQFRSAIDGALGTQSYVIDSTEGAFKSKYSSPKEVMEATKKHAIRQGEEGFVVMKNDNAALPIASSKEVALWGFAAYHPYVAGKGDLKAGNADATTIETAFKDAGYTLNKTVGDIYTKLASKTTTVPGAWGQSSTSYDFGYVATPGDMSPYKINEVPPEEFVNAVIDDQGGKAASAGWKEALAAGKSNRVAVVVFARGAGESNTYGPGTAVGYNGQATGKDPLELSADELAVVAAAKETSDKVIVLLNSGNTMNIKAIAKGGPLEVDAIGYMGVINDYQCTGIVNVLTGKANATGALTDTYVKDTASLPAMRNFGGGQFADKEIVNAGANTKYGFDSRYPNLEIANKTPQSSFGAGGNMYCGDYYMVEAEGIYVGYKYYETRFFDAQRGQGNATDAAGATQSTSSWDYDKEVVYSFGHGLSYYDYTQTLESVNVEQTENGYVTAKVRVTNNSDTQAKFLTQLYVNLPYTDYDKTNFVEKSAINFLNSAKVTLKGKESKVVDIKVPTKYLASYDYTKAKTYILDAGAYNFTVAAGAHEAVKNVLAGNNVKAWNNGALDIGTFSTDHGVKISNVADNSDINYFLPGAVTYLSRSDWKATWPKNYNSNPLKIGDSAKAEEWVNEIRGRQYVITNDGPEAKNVDGADNGVKFNAEQIGGSQITNINDPYWEKLVEEIPVNNSIGAVIHGGSRSDALPNIDNPIVGQHEGVAGVTGTYTNPDNQSEKYQFNVNSMTLLGSSFNPELGYEWGLIEGEGAMLHKASSVWGIGLTLRRTPYNGRNYEYISEDPMLTNVMGASVAQGNYEMGLLSGPKHIGFNDQEHLRLGIGVYINEQKMRETDLRGFQGFLEDGHGQAVMVAFNRIGPVNACHHQGMLKTILRGEWGFTGIISTDMATNSFYFDGASMIAATVTQKADFAQNDSHINKDNDHTKADSNYSYITVDSVKNDKIVEMARQNLKYQLFSFANSTVLNMKTTRVTPAWEAALNAIRIGAIVITATAGVCACGCFALDLIKRRKDQ